MLYLNTRFLFELKQRLTSVSIRTQFLKALAANLKFCAADAQQPYVNQTGVCKKTTKI
jgi:hypothetical protein